jgi:phosphate starvation-inducible membrane PsiE
MKYALTRFFGVLFQSGGNFPLTYIVVAHTEYLKYIVVSHTKYFNILGLQLFLYDDFIS